MKSKILWIDVETTGINPRTHDIIQLAVLIEIEGEIREEIELLMRPKNGCKPDPKALEINNRTLEEIQKFAPPEEGLRALKKSLNRYVDRFDKSDKFIPAGFYTRFDCDMLRGLFKKNGDKYYGSYFFNAVIDVQTYVARAIAYQKLRLSNYKLQTIAEAFGIEIKAHDAVSDIKATRSLFKALGGEVG